VISILNEDNLGEIGKLIKRYINSYFMKIFQFYSLLGQNRLSIEIQQSNLGSLVNISIEDD
jgi:hypothetical protein